MHPYLGRAFALNPALALPLGAALLHEGVIPAGLDPNLA
jgi:hypothetical protein